MKKKLIVAAIIVVLIGVWFFVKHIISNRITSQAFNNIDNVPVIQETQDR